jgi:hypothetical protein
VAEVVEGAIPEYPEHRLDFPLTTPGGTRIYVGVSIVHAPPEFREEVRLIFLFRNLAETVLDEGDPRLAGLDEPGTPPGPAEREPPSPAEKSDSEGASEETAPPPSRGAGQDDRDGAIADDPQAVRRRTLLSLRYTQPAGLVRAVVDELAADRGEDGSFVRVETSDDVPEALLDRQQASEALRLLLAGTLDRCDDPRDVRVRISRAEAPEGRPGRPAPAVRIEILYRRAQITDRDLSTEGEGRPAYRRADLAEAEKLIEANGGRLHRPRRDAEEQVLTVLLPAAG